MKLVIQTPEKTISKSIEDKDLDRTIQWIKTNFQGQEVSKGKYEHFRYALTKGGAIVIYKDNKTLRTRNTWIELRALAALSKILKIPFEHSIQLRINDWNTEIDGVNKDLEIMVEVKYQTIDHEWIEFYTRKMKKSGFKELYIIGKDFTCHSVPNNVHLFKFNIDFATPLKYYMNDFYFPKWIREHIQKRHIRFLLPNGRWTGIKKLISDTSKYSMEDKFRKQIIQSSKRNEVPVKIYYSMARMVNPVSEFHGKGYPLPYLILVFDVDSPMKKIIDETGYCRKCIEFVEPIAKEVEERLQDEGFQTLRLFSGLKGFHVYGLKENKVAEITPDLMFSLSYELKDLVDNIHFKGKLGFDVHRIIKLPNSIDLSTGILVSREFRKAELKDNLEEI